MNSRLAGAIFFVLFAAGFAHADLNATIRDLNISAEGNIGGFKTEVGAWFGVSGSHLEMVLRSVDSPADAAIVLWIGECAGVPVQKVLQIYRDRKGQGWGEVAKSLGIKPGSAAFHAMKEGNLAWRPGNTGDRGKARAKTKRDRKDMTELKSPGRKKNDRRRQKILHNNQTVLTRRGLIALENGNTRLARFHFEEAAGYERTPVVLSCLGYCLAREEEAMEKAFALCREAVRREPGNPLHHLHLGRVYLIAGKKEQAVTAFSSGLSFGEHPEILKELKRIGMRQPPLFTFLSRRHLLNRCCGLLLARLGLRFLLYPMGTTPART